MTPPQRNSMKHPAMKVSGRPAIRMDFGPQNQNGTAFSVRPDDYPQKAASGGLTNSAS